MDKQHLKKISDGLLKTFIDAGERLIELREIGLKKEIKSDNTPVTNGDIEVNNILTKKIKNITPDIPIVSEESSSNKSNTEESEEVWLDEILTIATSRSTRESGDLLISTRASPKISND